MSFKSKQIKGDDGIGWHIALLCRQLCLSRPTALEAVNSDTSSGNTDEQMQRGWLVEHVLRSYIVTAIKMSSQGRRALVESTLPLELNMLVANSLDRLSRRCPLAVLEAMTSAGVRVVATEDQVDTATNDWRRAALHAISGKPDRAI